MYCDAFFMTIAMMVASRAQATTKSYVANAALPRHGTVFASWLEPNSVSSQAGSKCIASKARSSLLLSEGLKGYRDFVSPVSMPVLFEEPFIRNTRRILYMYHAIPKKSVLRGGQLHVAGVGFTVALSERLALIGTKDGYSWVDAGIAPAGDGWNDVAIGLKYTLNVDSAKLPAAVRKRVRDALIGMKDDSVGRRILDEALIARSEVVIDRNYDDIRQMKKMAEEAGFTEFK